jgi:hypothetical protein
MARSIVFAFVFLLLASCEGTNRSQQSAQSGSTVTSERQPISTVHLNADEDPLPHSDGWIVGYDEGVPNSGSRFEAGGDRYSSGFLVVRLDTALTRVYPAEPPHERARADSLVISGLKVGETFARLCKVGSTISKGQTAGLMRDTVTEQWLKPRLAWFFDTVAVRIRAIPTDSILCMLEMPD